MAASLIRPTVFTLRVETRNPHAVEKMRDLALYLDNKVGIDVDDDGRCHDAEIEVMTDDTLLYGSVFDGSQNNADS